ncbi:MAG: DNA repair protein RecO [Dehalococcoidia bacterium]
MARPKSYRTEALVLKSLPLGEADLLVTLATPHGGKLRAVARGVRKPTSRMVGHLEPLTRLELALARGRNLDIVTQVQMVESFAALKADLEGTSRGLYLAELVDGFSAEGVASPGLYQTVLETLRFLQDHPQEELALRHFELRLLQASGFLPELHHCVECRSPVSGEGHRFTPEGGGLLCGRCTPANVLVLPLSALALEALRFLVRETLPELLRWSVPPPVAQEVQGLLRAVLRYVLEREVRSAAFLEHLRERSGLLSILGGRR